MVNSTTFSDILSILQKFNNYHLLTHTGEFRFHVLVDSSNRGNFFHANYLLSLTTDARKKHIYSTASHCLSKFSPTRTTYSLKSLLFRKQKRLDSYLMVQKKPLTQYFHLVLFISSISQNEINKEL